MLKGLRTFFVCGGGRILKQFLLMWGLMMLVGLLLGGPTIKDRISTGLWGCGVFTMLAFGLVTFRIVRFKTRNREALREIAESRRRIDAMTTDDLRAFVHRLSVTTPYFLAFAVQQPPDPSMPPAAADFFAVWDRVDLCTPGNPSPFLSICRDLVGQVPNNPRALKVGETYTSGSAIAVSLLTGRVTCHNPPIRPNEVEQVGAIESISYASLWHLLAALGDAQRIGAVHNFQPLARIPQKVDRPNWRIAGAKT